MAHHAGVSLKMTFVLFQLFIRCHSLTKPSAVKLEDNGYTGIVLAIHHSEPESERLIEEIITMLNNASTYLYEATDHRAFFKDVTILIPDTWEDKPIYQSPQNATFEGADIIVAPRNPRFAPSPGFPPAPHTKHYEGCGKQAAYIHLTTDFMLSKETEELYGNKGRVLVHEWGHYRWGLFNEYPDPIGDPDHVVQLYLSNVENRLLPPVCTRGFNTTSLTVSSNSEDIISFEECPSNNDFGLFDPQDEQQCGSFPNAVQDVTGCIMSGYTKFPTIAKFCDDLLPVDPKLEHNSEAPNKHNRLCSHRSCWSIMREHVDFKDANLPSLSKPDLVPTITLARSRPKRVVLVLDTSGSMNSFNRISKLASVSRSFITTIAAEGSYIGIVQFTSEGTRLSGLTLIDSDDTRNELAGLIPTSAVGGTCIGCGLETALQILTENGMTAAGGLVVLVTDGKDNEREMTEIQKQRYIEESVIIDGVAFSNTAEENIVNLQEATGGKLFLQTDSPNSTGLYEAFQSTMESGVNEDRRRIELHASSFTFASGEEFSSEIYIDPTVGKNTIFQFVYVGGEDGVQPLEVTINNPSGVVYDDSHEGYGEDPTFKQVVVRIPGVAEPGLWRYTVTNNGGDSIDLLISISAHASQEGVDPIVITSELSGSVTNVTANEPLVVFGEVRQGLNPIINATVIAILERPPDPDGNPSAPVELELLDNGAGADVTKDDGIYSRYFTEVTGIGFYGVRVIVSNEDGSAIILRNDIPPTSRIPPYVDPEELLRGNIPIIDGMIPPLPGVPLPEPPREQAPQFTRGISGGSSRIPDVPADFRPGDDLFPPSSILDLVATSSSYENQTVTMEFTAPGDDLDNGYASSYVIRVSESFQEISTNYSSLLRLNDTAFLRGNISSPRLSGDREVFVILVEIPEDSTSISYHFAMHAVDDVGNEGDKSNIVSIIFTAPSPTTPSITTVPQETTEIRLTTLFFFVTSSLMTTSSSASSSLPPSSSPPSSSSSSPTSPLPPSSSSPSLSPSYRTEEGTEGTGRRSVAGVIVGTTLVALLCLLGLVIAVVYIAKGRSLVLGDEKQTDSEFGYSDTGTIVNKVYTIKY